MANEKEISNYLKHLDKEALEYMVSYLLKEPIEAMNKINMMANEWALMYGKVE